MIIALHSHRARKRVEMLLHRPLGYVERWQARLKANPKDGFAEVTEAEYDRIKHLPGMTKAQAYQRTMTQLPLL